MNTLGRFGGRPAPNGFLFFKQKRFIESKRNLLHCVPDKISDKFMERNIYRVIFLRSVNVQNPPGAARPPFRWMKVKHVKKKINPQMFWPIETPENWSNAVIFCQISGHIIHTKSIFLQQLNTVHFS